MIRIGQEITVALAGQAHLSVAVLTGKGARPTALIGWSILYMLRDTPAIPGGNQ